MNKSDSIAALAAALSKAQAQIEGAIKDSTNPHFKSKYADLSSVVDAIREPLAKNGLAYVQTIHQADNAASVATMILHSSGEWLDCGAIAVPVSKGDAQGYGSALTYARRYSLSAAFGVAPEDDDGNAAAKAAPKAIPKAGPESHSPAKLGFEALEPDTKDFLRSIAADVILMLTKGEDKKAWDYIEDQGLDADCKVGLWSLLDSKQRATLKSMSAAAAQKVAA